MNEKEINYYYKATVLEFENDLERKRFEITNEYGYNFDSNARRKVNKRNYSNRLINNVNKEFIINKR